MRTMGRNILCIDDSDSALMLLKFLLHQEGFNPFLASGVKQALEIAEANRPDLILLDLSMPEVSGYDFLKDKEKYGLGNVPVIVISAFDSQNDLQTTKELGAADFVSKPINFDVIVDKIKSLLIDN